MRKRILLLITLILLLNVCFARDEIKFPSLNRMVVDQAGILTPSQEQELEAYLRRVENNTSAEIVLLTVKDLQGLPIEEYSIRLAEKWKPGKKERDNGLIMLVSTGDRKVRLEVGYGLEPYVTDAKSSYIIHSKILPAFRNNDYYGGIKAGLFAASGLISEEYEITEEELAAYQKSQKKSKSAGGFPFGFIILMLFLLFSRRRRGGLFTWLFLGSMLGRGGGRSSGGFGGFGGFSGGGGGFGGGGASGSW